MGRYLPALGIVCVLIGLLGGRYAGGQPATARPGGAPRLTATPSPTPACSAGWTIYPNPAPPGASVLNGITALASTDLWAVGKYTDSGTPHPLTVHGDGTSWTLVPSGVPGPGEVVLQGVAGVAPNDVWAVGSYQPYTWHTLIEHWDGSAWTIVPSPDGYSYQSHLYAVTALATNDAWAVGGTDNGGVVGGLLIEHWNGSAWTVVPGPNVGGLAARLYGVAAVSATDVWAVGGGVPGLSGGFVIHWDGSAWATVASPTNNGALYGVAVVAANDVWATGHYYGTGVQTLIEHWDGSAWTIVPSPSPGATTNHLYGVRAWAADNVWAVGDTDAPGGGTRTLVEHWDGTGWSVVPSPDGTLYGVAPGAASDLWAVGSRNTTALIARYGGLCATATVTPTGTSPPGSPSPTPSPPHTPTPSPSLTPTSPTRTPTAATATPTATVTPCAVQFNDVPPGSTFYPWIRCLACRGIVGGYPCGGPGEPCPGNYYRPNNNVTRGQTAQIVSESAGFADPVPSLQQTFEDVAPGSTFWVWIERLSTRGIIQGYPCGGPFEPCIAPTNRPYFRPNNPVTRGQLSKITSGAAGWTETPTGQTFEDAPPGSTFYLWIERLAARGIISGYPCGGPFEPCIAPANRPYFRPSNNATRGQMSKIAAAVFFPACRPSR